MWQPPETTDHRRSMGRLTNKDGSLAGISWPYYQLYRGSDSGVSQYNDRSIGKLLLKLLTKIRVACTSDKQQIGHML